VSREIPRNGARQVDRHRQQVQMQVITQIFAVPEGQAGPAAPVLEQHRLAVEIDLRRPDQPDKFLELIGVRGRQFCAAGIVELAQH
jgi:hypothetical protein